MNKKQIIGIVVLIIGIVLLSYGFYGKSRMDDARGDINSGMSLIPDNLAKDIAKSELHKKVDEYILPVTALFVGGILCIIIGGSVTYHYRGKK